jgi:hypothetical protein
LISLNLGWRKGGEKKVKEVNTDISTQLKEELQVTMLVLIYEWLLPILLERASGLFRSLLDDHKDLDVDNSHARSPAYLLQPQSDEH